jgi:hypothetical protein
MTILETGIATPTGLEFNPFDPQFLADLYPFFAEYRARAGFYSPALDYWVLTRYVHVRAAFRHTTLYSAANALSPIGCAGPRRRRELRQNAGRSTAAARSARSACGTLMPSMSNRRSRSRRPGQPPTSRCGGVGRMWSRCDRFIQMLRLHTTADPRGPLSPEVRRPLAVAVRNQTA